MWTQLRSVIVAPPDNENTKTRVDGRSQRKSADITVRNPRKGFPVAICVEFDEPTENDSAGGDRVLLIGISNETYVDF